MRMIWGIAGIALGLCGCASSTEIRGPGGQVAHLIECPGAAVSMGACYEKANALCPAGYNVLDAQQAAGPVTVTQFGLAQGVQRQIVVQCAK
jgi:hypothetical protein